MDPGSNAVVRGAVADVAKDRATLGALVFTSDGIAAGSYAAKMMMTDAVNNGGGVTSGGVVSSFQKAGASGSSEDSTGTGGGWLSSIFG